MSFYNKLLFYSVISNYRTLWILGKIKKTCTVLDRGTYQGWKNCLISGVLSHCWQLRMVSSFQMNLWLFIIQNWMYCFGLDRSSSWVWLMMWSWMCCGRQSRAAKIPLRSDSMCSGKLAVARALSLFRDSHNSRVVVQVACCILERILTASIVGWYWVRWCVHCLDMCP